MRTEFSRLLAVLMTVLVLAVIGVFGILPLTEHLSSRVDHLRQLISENARFQELIDRNITPAAGSERDPSGRIDLGSDAPGIAGASIEGYVRDLAARAGIQIRGSEVLPEILDAGIRRVRLRVAATAVNQNLAQLIVGLNRTRPWVGIEELQIQAPARANGDVAPMLNLRITFYGLALVADGDTA